MQFFEPPFHCVDAAEGAVCLVDPHHEESAVPGDVYAFTDAYAQPAFDRSATNGFRCIRITGDEANLANLDRSIERKIRDFYAQQPVPDEVFAQYLRLFVYDKTPLDAKIEEDKPAAHGTRQKITFNAAY